MPNRGHRKRVEQDEGHRVVCAAITGVARYHSRHDDTKLEKRSETQSRRRAAVLDRTEIALVGGRDVSVFSNRQGGAMLFSDRSIWTMIHGIGLGGAALMGLAAALFYLWAARGAPRPQGRSGESRALAALTIATAGVLWLAVLAGTYIVFPPYRATPPAGLTDLAQFPRSLIQANPDTAWLHSFAMESKEHVPWIASMLATAVAFVTVRYPSKVLDDDALRSMAGILLGICFALVSFVSLMGVFVNKVAPLQ
jgi:hypothetical protein